MSEYLHPSGLAEALDMLASRSAVPIAGGTDLMVRHRRHGALAIRLSATPLFVGHLPELGSVVVGEDALTIGAAVTLNELMDHPTVPAGLKMALREFASPAIRNAGTLGGNICNASPAADTLPFLCASDATVFLATASQTRSLGIADFVVGPGATARRADELVTHVVLPRDDTPYVFYRKVAPRRSNALSKLSVYAHAGFEESGGRRVVRGFRLALGAVAPTVVRDAAAESLVNGKTSEELRRAASGCVDAIADRIIPIDDQRSTAGYRRNTALRLVRHLLEQDLPLFLEKP